MRHRFLLLAVLFLFLTVGCASSINPVYKTGSMTGDEPYARITVNGGATTITHVFTLDAGGRVTAEPMVPKDGNTTGALKLAYSLTPWGLLTRAMAPGSRGVYRVPAGRVVLQVFNQKPVPIVSSASRTPRSVVVGYYSFFAATMEAYRGYTLDSPVKPGQQPRLTPPPPDFRALTGSEISAFLAGHGREGGREATQ